MHYDMISADCHVDLCGLPPELLGDLRVRLDCAALREK